MYVLFQLSVVQNAKLSKLMTEEMLKEVLESESPFIKFYHPEHVDYVRHLKVKVNL